MCNNDIVTPHTHTHTHTHNTNSYVSWNLHEVIPDQFDFTGILDIKAFILMAQHLGLHVIVRPGPYICAEWEMGGLPAYVQLLITLCFSMSHFVFYC